MSQNEKNSNWGGKRTGSGRKTLGRKQVNFRCTNDEADILRRILNQMRDHANEVDYLALLDAEEQKVMSITTKKIKQEITVFIDNTIESGDLNKTESYFFIVGTNGSVRKIQQKEPGSIFELKADDDKWYPCEVKRLTDGKYFFAPMGKKPKCKLKNDSIYHVRNVQLFDGFTNQFHSLT